MGISGSECIRVNLKSGTFKLLAGRPGRNSVDILVTTGPESKALSAPGPRQPDMDLDMSRVNRDEGA